MQKKKITVLYGAPEFSQMLVKVHVGRQNLEVSTTKVVSTFAVDAVEPSVERPSRWRSMAAA
jgi:hypothetical protein